MSEIIIMEGPDGCGKTEIGRALAGREEGRFSNYFKVGTEGENWRKGQFINALRFDQTFIAEFLRQVPCKVVIDRAYPSEFVYSKVFGRETDEEVLLRVDQTFADLGTNIIVCLRSDYTKNRPDELVPAEKLEKLHDGYLKFIEWTACDVIAVYVDAFIDNTYLELDAIKPNIRFRTLDERKRITVLR